jgi:hypothetical protein
VVSLKVNAATNRISTFGFSCDAAGNLIQWPGGTVTISAEHDVEGRHRFRDIQPGTYRLAAVAGGDAADILDPLVLPPDSAITITFEAGKSQTADIRMIRR